MKKQYVLAALAASWLAPASAAFTTTVPEQVAFFDNIRSHCGKAFEGQVVSGAREGDGFSDQRLVMHVRVCEEHRLEIPFHVGDNASRTWILTQTGAGILLKHDHRMKDGSDDESTMYGGHTEERGYANYQAFPADDYSKDLFTRLGFPQSNGNTWHMQIYPEKFVYHLTRDGRDFKVDFDLTKPVALPVTPWGYED
ncbi:hypothetical protein [Ferrimonas marina]|uniref:Secreted protein n=1 Tax=Ferrimonas marina TaxID=299255 RepID=A0A1M5ZQT0_9GAMM|nr:hypothetical protein [Ferrimonas marina]SHI26303.1 hypothetical protein SAMN02745129_0473 [Ferrimonas marina]